MDEITYQSATSLAGLIRSRAITSSEATRAHLAQIAKHNSVLNAVVQLFEADALARASEADGALARGELWGPLHGVPVTIKEAFWIKGTPSTANSKLNKDFVASEDAVVVARIKRAGAVILGKTNVPANLAGYQVKGDLYPEGKNPFDTGRTPGGSTGGGSAAVAAGMTPLELGGDSGGSLRVPAHFCGLYGLKPTDKTVPRHGMVPRPRKAKGWLVHMAQAGPLARSIDDVQLLWEIIRGPHESDGDVPRIEWRPPSGRVLRDYRIAWTDGWNEFIAGAETKVLLENLVARIREQGGNPEKAAPDIHARAREVYFALFTSLIGQDMPWPIRKIFSLVAARGFLKGRPDYVRSVARGLRMDAQEYAAALGVRRELVEEIERFFGRYDVLLCPVSFGPAFPRCKIGETLDFDGVRRPDCEYCWPYVVPFNASGHPALVMPMGLSREGLPIGVQLVGPSWSEPELLHFARQLVPLTSGFVKPRLAS